MPWLDGGLEKWILHALLHLLVLITKAIQFWNKILYISQVSTLTSFLSDLWYKIIYKVVACLKEEVQHNVS